MFALEGIRVLDLSRLVPGPYATMLLADLGADVIKIEQPGGDPLRAEPPAYRETNVAFCMLNRGKRSVTLDLKQAAGRSLFLDLAKSADVIVEGFRPGVVERLGVGYDDVRAVNARVIYCSLSGYGREGALRDVPGHDINYIAYAGILGTTGSEGAPPAIPSVPIADLAGGGQMAVVSILAALFARERGGGGQFVDVSMLDGARSLMMLAASGYFAGEAIPSRGGFPLTGGQSVYGVYETKDERWVALAALESKFASAFCQKVGIEPGTLSDREGMVSLFRARTQAEWLSLSDLPIAPVLTVEEALRNHVVWIDDPREGRVAHLPFPVKLSTTPARAPSRSPQLGEHTEGVLASLGLSPGEISRLRREKVV